MYARAVVERRTHQAPRELSNIGSIGTSGRIKSTTAPRSLRLKRRPPLRIFVMPSLLIRQRCPFFQTQALGLYGPTRRGSVHVWIESTRSVSAAATCIGPLSTLITKNATRISQINCSREVWLIRSMQLCGGASIVQRDRPTRTMRVGANARQNSFITTSESDLPEPRAKGCSRINGGYSSKRGGRSPVGIGQRSPAAPGPTVAPAH